MDNFIVLEVTRNAQGKIAVYPSAKETEASARSKYHEILTRAPQSNSPVHAAVLLNWDGYELEHEFYVHEPEPEEPSA